MSLDTLSFPRVKLTASSLDFRGRKFTKSQLAGIAATIVADHIPVVLRVGHAARVFFGVSTTYIKQGLALSADDRRAVCLGERPLNEQTTPQEQIARIVRSMGVDAALELLAAADADLTKQLTWRRA